MAALGRAAGLALGPRRGPKVSIKSSPGQRPVITTMTVVIGLGILRSILVTKKQTGSTSGSLPDRKFWVSIGIIGFTLALIAELAPKFGKSMAYLVLTGSVFSQTDAILAALQETNSPAADKSRKQAADTIPAALGSTQPQTVSLFGSSPPAVGIPTGNYQTPKKAKRPKKGPYQTVIA